MMYENKRLALTMLLAGMLLAIPAVIGALTGEMKWSAFDFALAGALLFGTLLAIEVILRTVKTWKHRLVLCAIVLGALALLWVEVSVGLFGSPIAGS